VNVKWLNLASGNLNTPIHDHPVLHILITHSTVVLIKQQTTNYLFPQSTLSELHIVSA